MRDNTTKIPFAQGSRFTSYTTMTLSEIINTTCLVGLSYFDTNGNIIQQQQLAGEVVNVDEKNGISIRLVDTEDDGSIATDAQPKIFILPPHLACWFKAPEGNYKNGEGKTLIENPDYFVTWDVHQKQEEKQGDHEWWEWVPRTVPPKVN